MNIKILIILTFIFTINMSASISFSESGQILGNDTNSSIGVAVGDLDSDGDLDAFITNNLTNPNEVWLNDGNGTFSDSGQSLGNDTNNSRVAELGDFDGDGDLDAFVANAGNEGNEVWLNDGNGNFSDSGQSLGTGSTNDVAVGDVDGDGDLDVFTTNYLGVNRVWLNDGFGSFGGGEGDNLRSFSDSGQSIGDAGTKHYGVELADLDSDGDLDAFFTTDTTNQVWLNNGSGTFSNSGQSLGNSPSMDVALGDVDGDGDLDAFISNWATGNRVWLNNGNATFSDSGQSLGSANSRIVKLADLDSDGDLDAFVTNDGQTNKIWLNDGSGNFSDSGLALGDSMSYDVELADLDSDGDLDAFVTNDGQANKIWLNKFSFISFSFSDSGQLLGNDANSSIGVALGDLDRDGDLDAFVTNYLGNNPNEVWLNDGNGNFSDSGQSLGSSESRIVELADLDSDGDLDAFVPNTSGEANKIWLNNGSGIFSDSGQSLGNLYSNDVALGDVDRDGDLDAFVANYLGVNKVWLNDGNATFSDSGQSLGSTSTKHNDVELADLDKDGDLDAFVVTDSGNKVWLNNGNGTFSDSGQSLGSSSSVGLALGDIDRDGDLDAFVANNVNQANRVWLNNGSGTFSDSGQSLGSNYSLRVSLKDIDKDGDLDAFVTNNGANKIWLNDGNGIFSDSGQSMGSSNSYDIKLNDLDRDGDLDAFVTITDTANRVWLNNLIRYDSKLNLANLNLPENNITNISFIGVDGNTEKVSYSDNFQNGDNNITTIIENFGLKYLLKIDINSSTEDKEYWYNFSNGNLYLERNSSDEFKQEINITNNIITIDFNTILFNENSSIPILGLQEFQSIATIGAVRFTFFEINSEKFLAVTNFYDDSTYNLNSKIYKWSGSSFVEFQSIATSGARNFEFFEIDSEKFLAISNFFNNTTYSLNSKIYKWNGSSFVEFQSIATNGGIDFKSFIIDGDTYLAIANFQTNSSINIDSKIYKWNGSSFVEFQSIATNGVFMLDSFSIDGDTYLAFANNRNSTNTSQLDGTAKIYKWNGSSFVEFQSIATIAARSVEFFQVDSKVYLFISHNSNIDNTTASVDSKIYKWNGSSFVEFQSIPTIGANYSKFFEVRGEAYLAVSNSHNLSTYNLNSKVYKWNGSNFVEFQSIATNGAIGLEHFQMDEKDYLAIANYHNDTTPNIDSKIYKIYNMELNLTNINLSEHNISSITLYGVDGNSESFNYTNIINGENNLSAQLNSSDSNFSIKFDVNRSGIIEDWFYNFSNQKIYPDNNNSSEFKTTIDVNSNSFVVDLSQIDWIYYIFSGNIISNDKNVTDLALINSSNGLIFEENLSSGASSFDINFSSTGEYNLSLVTDRNKSWYYDFTTGEINSTYIASSISLSGSYSKDLNLSEINFDDYEFLLNFNFREINLSEHNITSIAFYTSDLTTEDLDIYDYGSNLRTISNGENNYTIPINALNNNFILKFIESLNNDTNINWYYNFANSKLYLENNGSSEFQTYIDLNSEVVNAELNLTNWNYYTFSGNIVSNDKNVTDIALTHSNSGVIFEDNLSSVVSSFDINFSTTGEYNLSLVTDRNRSWYYNFTTGEINSTYIGSSISLNSSYSKDLNLSERNYEGYITLAPIFTPSTTSLNFGDVESETTKTLPITITNSGNLSGVVEFSLTTDNFTLSPNSCSLNIGQSCQVDVTFAPSYVSNYIDTLSIFNVNKNSSQTLTIFANAYSTYIPPITTTLPDNTGESFTEIIETTNVDIDLNEAITLSSEGEAQFSGGDAISNIAVSESEDGTTKFDIQYDSTSEIDVIAKVEVAKDGATTSSLTISDDSGNVVETNIKLPTGSTVLIDTNGDIKQTLESEKALTEVVASKKGEVKANIKTIDGKELIIKAPVGVKVEVDSEGGVKQNLNTKETLTEVKASIDGKTEVKLENIDGDSAKLEIEVDAETELKANGSVTQKIVAKSGQTTDIEVDKRADVKGVVKTEVGEKIELNPPKGANVKVDKSNILSITNEAMTNDGFVNSEMRVNPDGTSSVEVNIDTTARGGEPKKILYSTRKDISNVKLEVIFDELSSLRAKSLAKGGKIKALFSARKSFSFKESNLREVELNSSTQITPILDSDFEENLYFNNKKELKLKSGKAEIKGFFSTRGSFSYSREKAGDIELKSSRRDFSIKSTKADISENSIIATMSENTDLAGVAKLETTLNANSSGDLIVDIVNFGNNKRGLKTVAKKFTYSVRKEFSSVKLEVLEKANYRITKSPKIKTTFSTRREFSLKSSNLRDMSEVKIVPVDENSTFIETILEDSSRYIELSYGKAKIIIDSIEKEMTLNEKYELPSLEIVEIGKSLNITQEINLELQKGWNLKSIPISEDISDKFIFGDYDLIWSFKNNSWFKNPNILYYKDGYWIKLSRSENITFKGYSYIPNLKILPLSWMLVGTGTKIEDIFDLMDREKIEEIYQFKDKRWLTSNEITALEIGDGFWIKKVPADYILNLKEGWNLLSLPTNQIVIDMSTFGEYETILIYKDREWIRDPSQIEPKEGFWIKSNEDSKISFYGESYNISLNTLNSGWSLVGGVINQNSLNFDLIKVIFLFKDNSWIEIDSIDDLTLIKRGDGFWIYK